MIHLKIELCNNLAVFGCCSLNNELKFKYFFCPSYRVEAM